MSNESERSSTKSSSRAKPIAPLVLEDYIAPIPEAAFRSKKGEQRPHAVVANITYQYSGKNRTGGFDNLEYNLSEIAKAEHTESYIMRAFNKHITLILKNGWYLDGRNPETISYMYERIRELESNTETSFDYIVRQVVQGMVSYCNAFLVLVRDKRSSGKRRVVFKRDMAPIAGVFPADATSMEAKTDKKGRVTGWRQNPKGGAGVHEDADFRYAKHSVIHFFYNRKAGFIAGTPWILPALDDVRAWRRLEELAEVLASRYAFPLFHYAIGNNEFPAQDFDNATSEISDAKTKIEQLPSDGVFITSHRHKIVAIGTDGAVIDLAPYLEYWEKRVISGLNMSGVDLGKGETANRATAVMVSKGLADFCTDLAGVISETFSFDLFKQLLEEGGHKLTEENRVYLKFPVIDTDEMVKIEKHAQFMFQSNTIPEGEMRRRIKAQPIDDKMRKELYFELYDKELQVLTHEQSLEQAKVAAAAKPASGVKKTIQGQKNKSENVNRPTNKEGKLTAKTKPVRDALFKVWGVAAVDTDTFKKECVLRYTNALDSTFMDGMRACASQAGAPAPVFVGGNVKEHFRKCMLEKLGDVLLPINSEANSLKYFSTMGILKCRLDTLFIRADRAAFNFGFMYATRILQTGRPVWESSNERLDGKELTLKDIVFDELAPSDESAKLIYVKKD